MFQFYEFFAGGGMARAGLGDAWNCVFANDIDEKKSAVYKLNWGDADILQCDVADVSVKDLSGHADLCWASFPCQDLSLAGTGDGLSGKRSGSFWPFWDVIRELKRENRQPKLLVLENVCGALTSHQGDDFRSICKAMMKVGYFVGAIVVDAIKFVPQSRKRLFFIGVHRSEIQNIPQNLMTDEPDKLLHPGNMVSAVSQLSRHYKKQWLWFFLPDPANRQNTLADIVEKIPSGVEWHSEEQTQYLLSLMSEGHTRKVSEAVNLSIASGKPVVGTIYKRTRKGEQRAEVRFDGVSGCLRTAKGGSSRQIIMIINGELIQSRLLSSREAARLMGLADDYKLPNNYNDAYTLAGDGLVVPVVRHIALHLLEPLLLTIKTQDGECQLACG